MNKKWNVVAIMVCVLTLAYFAVEALGLYIGKVTFDEFNKAALPIVTAWGGYLAAMLNKPE